MTLAEMQFVVPDLMPASAEIFLLTMACVIMMVDLLVKDKKRTLTFGLTLASVIGTFLITAATSSSEIIYTFSNMYVADLMGTVLPGTFGIHDYKQVADNESMLNTPSTFSWYVCGLVFQWMKSEGGLAKIGERNERKAKALYDYIDSQDFYKNPVAKKDRSIMNVPFTLPNSDVNDAEFLKGAKAAGLNGLKGHRAVGGMRASIYNAMPEAGVAALIDYMKHFAKTKA